MRLAQEMRTKTLTADHTADHTRHFRWWSGVMLESYCRCGIGVSTKKANTRLPLKEVNKHFFDLLTRTHMSSCAAVAAAEGSQLRLFCDSFVGSSFINGGQKEKKDGLSSFTHSLSLSHTQTLSEETRKVLFFLPQ